MGREIKQGKKKMTPYQHIMWNAKIGIGIRLTREEVRQLSRDSAISERALYDDDEQANPGHRP